MFVTGAILVILNLFFFFFLLLKKNPHFGILSSFGEILFCLLYPFFFQLSNR